MADVFERLKAALGDRYAIERELGSGGMATVYLAEDLKHDRKVAVKVLRPDLAAALGPERFLQEIKIAAQLHHPHILPLHDSGEADGFLYYVMPYEAGRSLRDKLATEGELPIGEAVRLLRDVVDALSHAHEQGVVHRDIKPENILLSGHHALVSDFGVAKAVSEATGRDKLTTAGVALGTPAYMAPEQASADPHIDQRADIYGVGALAYEVLTGRPPFLGSTPQQVLSAHVTETAEPVTRYRTTVPPVLEQLVMRCLEKRPADRWQSAQELVTQLEALTTPSGGITPTDTRPITAAVGRRRTGLYVVLGIAAAVAAVAAAAWLLRPVGEQELNPNLIAVAPFDVLDTSLEDPWREGLAQIVALGVDGAGPLRCVPPSVIFKHWSGPGDMASVSAVGRDAGAGLGVYGRLTGSGPDSVRMTATLFDVRNDVALGEFDDLYESVDRIDRLGDSLAARILTVLSRVRPLGAVRTNSLGSSSPAAIKAFLHGEQHYRRFNVDSARFYYDQAIASDSGFGLAYARKWKAMWWRETVAGALMALRAGALNHGLARRESLLIVIDSLWADYYVAVSAFASNTGGWSRFDRIFTTGDILLQEYPHDPEVWYEVGETWFHLGPFVGVTEQETYEAFRRAVTLDSGYVPAYEHLVELSLTLDGPAEAMRVVDAYLGRIDWPTYRERLRLVRELISGGGVTAEAQRMIDSADGEVLFAAWQKLHPWPDSAESAVHITRALMALDESPLAVTLLTTSLAQRGRLREAYALNDRLLTGPVRQQFLRAFRVAQFAEFGVLPPDTARAVFENCMVGDPSCFLYFALRWWAAQQDTASLKRYIGIADSILQMASVPDTNRLRPDTAAVQRFGAQVGRAYLALARRDTAAALAGLAALRQWPVPLTHNEELTRAQLLIALDSLTEVAELLRVFPGLVAAAGAEGVVWTLERARVADRLGDREAAIQDYSYVLDAWRHADPELQPYVEEARTALERLAGGR